MKKNVLEKPRMGIFFFKLLMVMKLSVFILCLSVLTAVASGTYSQTKTTKLSLVIQNESIENVLKTIEDQSVYRFFYSGNINTDKKVSINSRDMDIETVLAEILKRNKYWLQDRWTTGCLVQ